MKRVLLVLGLLITASGTALAQSEDHPAQGYVFFAPGVTSSDGTGFAHVGGGGEKLIKNVGIGAELGYLAAWQYWSEGIGVFSPNVSYHFQAGKISPFVTGGYTLFFRGGTANGFNFGAGMNYWFRPRTALRLEVRDNVMADYEKEHLVGFRVGLTFR